MSQQQNPSTAQSQILDGTGFISNVSKSLSDSQPTSVVVDAEVTEVAEPETTEATEVADAEATEEKPTDLNAALDEYEGTTETTEEPVEEFSYESEQFQALEKFVKDKLGIPSLKDAVEAINALQEKVASFEQAQAAQTVQTVQNTLQAEWGVTEAEYNRRITLVSEYHSNLLKQNPALAKQLDNAEGIQLIWSRLDKTKKSPGVTAKGVGSVGSKGRTFKKSEITNWMLNDPATYQANAAAIAEARKAGRITND